MVEVECEFCGEVFDRIPSLVERVEHTFCGRECQIEWQKDYQSGENNPSWSGGKEVHTCDECGNDFQRWESQSSEFCSLSCKYKGTQMNVAKAPDKYFYNSKVWDEKRTEIRERDGGKCKWCESTDSLQVHHIRPMSLGGDELSNENLVTLCLPCHRWAHKAIDYSD